ncbi:hypothetical protein [Myxococcus sp. AB025B]|uniref:hypothetical protein n=1 Tax=Myxococcus sp. AB025B TaxID=2562794 RepID=UPI0011441BFB|nr:hypothetical protein [Myxococcus sp. AB025B]
MMLEASALVGVEVRESPFLPPGHFVGVGQVLFTRHMSEFLLLLSGARWHVERDRCPSWTDATECQCMRGGDA